MGRTKESGHLAQLDGLRAFAVVAVLLHHTIPVLNNRLNLGALGVRLFFVLSGFLITGILLRARIDAEQTACERRRVLWSFYARRFLRIFPLYYLVLVSAALLGLPKVRETFGWQVAYLSNFYSAFQPEWPGKPINHLWSLSVEEQFYLIWPTLVLFTPWRWLPVVFGATLAIGPLHRAMWLLAAPSVSAGALTLSCLDSLGIGALLAYLDHRGAAAVHQRRWLSRIGLSLGVGLLAMVIACRVVGAAWRFRMVFEDTAYLLISVWLVDRAARGFRGLSGAVLEWRPLVYIGTISYGVYVYHEFVPPLLRKVESALGVDFGVPDEGWLMFAVVSGVTLVLASLSWRYFEKPLNDLKRHFPYVTRGTATTVAEPQLALVP